MKKIISKIRDMFHIIGGFTIMYWFADKVGLFNNNNFSNEFERMVMAIVGLTMFSLAIGGIFEFLSKEIDNEIIPDIKDVVRTGIGGLLAAFATLLPFNPLVFNLLLSIILIGLVYEIIRIYNKKKRK